MTHAPITRAVPSRSVCIFCGSASGNDPIYRTAAEAVGTALAEAGIGLVYGGGGRGLMGTVARAVIAAGGRVVGIIPDFLTDAEHVLCDAQESIVVPDMHTRKRMMFERADAFIALPGGIGTLEELVEQLTWVQLARHDKPVLIADIDGFWEPLVGLLKHMEDRGFIKPETRVRYLVATDPADVVPMLLESLDRPDETEARAETLMRKLA